MLQLRYQVQGETKTFTLKQGLTSIGRLPTSDLVLPDPSVSRHHASVRVVDGECRLQDAGSRFGTFLNGQIVRDEVDVLPGATIKLGEVSLVLEQHVPEQELLTEDHQISEGPGTIYKPMAAPESPKAGVDSQLMKLLAEVGRTVLSSQSLN